MAQKRKFTKEQIQEALEKNGGIYSYAAEVLGTSRKSIWRYVNEYYPELKELREDIHESTIDIAEGQLHRLIKQGDKTAIIFFLKTQGKQRGYVERTQVAQQPVDPKEAVKGMDLSSLPAEDRDTISRILEKAMRNKKLMDEVAGKRPKAFH